MSHTLFDKPDFKRKSNYNNWSVIITIKSPFLRERPTRTEIVYCLSLLFRKGKHRLFELFVEVTRSPDNVTKNAISFCFPEDFKDEVKFAIIVIVKIFNQTFTQ